MSQLPSVPDRGILAHYSKLPADPMAGVMTTLDLTQPGNVKLAQHAMAGDDGTTWDLPADVAFRVQHLLFHFAEKVNPQTGEDISGPMCTMLGPDGVFHTGSKFAFRDLQRIALFRGLPPWDPPIKVRAVKHRSRNNKDYQSLLLEE